MKKRVLVAAAVGARWLLWSLAVVVLVPAVEAQSSSVRVRIVPQFDEVALGPGERGGVNLEVTMQVGAACTSGTRFGVSIVMVDPFPKWAGASAEPANLQFEEDGGTKSSRLEIFPAEDAPAGASVTYRLRPEVKLPSASNCTGELRVDSTDALVKLTILSPDQTGGPGSDGNGSPGLGGSVVLVLVAGVAFLRRRG